MALQKEIWINSIVGNLIADNSFAARSVDHSEFVNGKTVHIPNAGSLPSISKNRSSFPASISTRSDVDLTYSIAEYTSDPIRIPHAEQVELSYNKRESVIGASRSALLEAFYSDLIESWRPASGDSTVVTTGSSETAHITTATGNRKAVTEADILSVKKIMDATNVPQKGRYALLDAVMYNQLLAALSGSAAANFLSCADKERGVLGGLYGFEFYMRSEVAKTAADGTKKLWSADAAATDSAAGIFWQENCVSRAVGDTVIFEKDDDPSYYSDVMSFLVRAGGSYLRNDKKGVVTLYQGTPSN